MPEVQTPQPILSHVEVSLAKEAERRKLAEYLARQIHTGATQQWTSLWGEDYDRIPVGIRQFIEDEYYIGRFTSELSEAWKKDLEHIFSPDSLITLLLNSGAIGVAKTTASIIAMLYKVYCLGCMKDPAVFYGLFPKSKIVFGIFNVTLDRSKSGFDTMRDYIDGSPYFQQHFPRKTRTGDRIIFPEKNILVELGSMEGHALGANLFGFILDEANFFRRLSEDKSAKTRAHRIFRAARLRLVSRFMYKGRVPGLMILVSSRQTQSDFMEEMLADVEKNELFRQTTHVVSRSLWEAFPNREWGDGTFEVMVGDDRRSSRILEPEEAPPPGYKTIEVPQGLMLDFSMDVDLALRDIAGVATSASTAFFPRPAAFLTCIDRFRRHPFNMLEIETLGARRGHRLDEYLNLRAICRVSRSRVVPLVDPGVARYCHVDIGLSHHSLGICVGHTYRTVSGAIGAYLDLLCRINAPQGEEIDLQAIVDFLHFLRNMGFPIAKVSFDQFQSAMPRQVLFSGGFDAERMSIQLPHYNALKSAINESRISMYEYEPLLRELRGLRLGLKLDHRPAAQDGGSDDVADAVAGVVSHCLGIGKTVHEKTEARMPSGSYPMPVILHGR